MTDNSPDVQILLSTYNGEQFLKAQLDSFSQQNYEACHLQILIRDDGSSDSTVTVIRSFVNNFKCMRLIIEDNIGYIKSFFKLISLSDPSCKYWGFSDQDDVWMPDKISRAVAALNIYTDDIPALYCSNVTITTDDLQPICDGDSVDCILNFKHAIVECVPRGCTIFFNRAMRTLLLMGCESHNIGHDYWCGMVASGIGKIIYDPTSTMLYRRHKNNYTGIILGTRRWLYRLSFYKKYYCNQSRLTQTKEFMKIYERFLTPEAKSIAEHFIDRSLKNRLISFFYPPFERSSYVDQLVFRILFLLNLI